MFYSLISEKKLPSGGISVNLSLLSDVWCTYILNRSNIATFMTGDLYID